MPHLRLVILYFVNLKNIDNGAATLNTNDDASNTLTAAGRVIVPSGATTDVHDMVPLQTKRSETDNMSDSDDSSPKKKSKKHKKESHKKDKKSHKKRHGDREDENARKDKRSRRTEHDGTDNNEELDRETILVKATRSTALSDAQRRSFRHALCSHLRLSAATSIPVIYIHGKQGRNQWSHRRSTRHCIDHSLGCGEDSTHG